MHRHFRCARNILGLGRHENPVGPGDLETFDRAFPLRSHYPVGPEANDRPTCLEANRLVTGTLSYQRAVAVGPLQRQQGQTLADPYLVRRMNGVFRACIGRRSHARKRDQVERLRLLFDGQRQRKALGIVIGIGSELYEIERHLGTPHRPRQSDASSCM